MGLHHIWKSLYLMIYFWPLLPYWGVLMAAGMGHINFFAWWVLIIGIILAAIDHLLGKFPLHPDADQTRHLKEDRFYRRVTLFAAPMQILLLLFSAVLYVDHPGLNLAGRVGWIVSVGLCSSLLAIAVGHELLHKHKRTDRAISALLFASICNPFFMVVHLRIHHQRVATPFDPSSAKLNESFYHFFLRAVVREPRDAWQAEGKRLHNKGYGVLNWRNDLICMSVLSAVVGAAFFATWHWRGVIFFLGQSAIGLLVLNIGNYIGHYGLQRHQLNDGGFERVAQAHTWDSCHLIVNLAALNIARHPDHHMNPGLPYQMLRSREKSPQMPTGYLGMYFLALIPPLWFRVMNPRIEVFFNSRVQQAGKSDFEYSQ